MNSCPLFIQIPKFHVATRPTSLHTTCAPLLFVEDDRCTAQYSSDTQYSKRPTAGVRKIRGSERSACLVPPSLALCVLPLLGVVSSIPPLERSVW